MTQDPSSLSLGGPRDRAETALGFIAIKAAALREGLLAWADPTQRASCLEEQEALQTMRDLLNDLLASPVFEPKTAEPEPKTAKPKTAKPKTAKPKTKKAK